MRKLILPIAFVLIISLQFFQNYWMTKKIEALEINLDSVCTQRVIRTALVLNSSIEDIKIDIAKLESRISDTENRLKNWHVSISY